MSIIVHKDESIDEALKRLHGEALRENIFDTVNKKRYHIKKAETRSEKKRQWMKRKKRLRQAKRKKRSKMA